MVEIMRLVTIAFALTLPGCADDPPEKSAVPAGISSERGLHSGGQAARSASIPVSRCNGLAAHFVLGERLTAALAERARTSAGARYIRIILGDQEFTTEFLADRLNLQLDAAQVVVHVFCG